MTYKWNEMNIVKRDSLIAEKVFGYVKQLHGEDFTWVKRDESGEVAEYQPQWFSPSRRISDAWEIIDELSARGLYTDVHTHPDFYVVTVMTSSVEIVADVVMSTAPEAICLAALRAVGVGIE